MAPEMLKGLVLAGGKSQRMGIDKGEIVYHDKPQKIYAAGQLQQLGLETYISQRKDQKRIKGNNYILDAHTAMGPLTGLYSAFEIHTCAWLCLGCDYPLLQVEHLKKLLKMRDKSVFATVFQDKTSGFLIPTLAIYESSFFELLKKNVHERQFSLQFILKNNPCCVVPVAGAAFASVDKKEDYEKISRKIGFQEENRQNKQ